MKAQTRKNNQQNPLIVLEDRINLLGLEEELDLIAIKDAVPLLDKDGVSRKFDLLLGKEVPGINTQRTLYRIPFLVSSSLDETYKRITITILKDPRYSRFLVKEHKNKMPILYQINPEQKNKIIPSNYYTTDIKKLKEIPKDLKHLIDRYTKRD